MCTDEKTIIPGLSDASFFGIGGGLLSVAGLAIAVYYARRSIRHGDEAAGLNVYNQQNIAIRNIMEGKVSVETLMTDIEGARERQKIVKRSNSNTELNFVQAVINAFNTAYKDRYLVKLVGKTYEVIDCLTDSAVENKATCLVKPVAMLAVEAGAETLMSALRGAAYEVADEGGTPPTEVNPPPWSVVPVPGGRRQKDSQDGTYSVIDSLCEKLYESHEMLFVNPDKLDLLNYVSQNLSVLLNSPNLSAADRRMIDEEILPQLRSGYLSIFAYEVTTKGISNVMASSTLAVDVSNINTWINRDHWTKTSYYTNSNFFDTTVDANGKMNILIAQNSGGQTRFVTLVGTDTQYSEGLADAAIDIVALAAEAGRKYNISTGASDDVLIVDFSSNSDANTAVNLLGGDGRDTYIIKVRDGHGRVPGKVTILDFNPNEDKIIFDTGIDNYLKPNIKQTWSGYIFAAPRIDSTKGDGTVQLYAQTPYSRWHDWWIPNRGRIDTLEGTGIPMVEIWSARSGLGGNMLAQNNNAIQTTYKGDLSPDATTTAVLIPTSTYQSTYSQFENANDRDCFKVGLLAGNFYRFRIIADPSATHIISDTGPITKVQLTVKRQLENGQEVTVVTSATPTAYNHDYEISFFAQSDGLHYLYAGSDLQTPIGSYDIKYREAKPQDVFSQAKPIVEGQFKGGDDFQVFTADLTAGQSVRLTDYADRASLSIFDPSGIKINPRFSHARDDTYTFMANETGKYRFVAEDKVKQWPVQDFKIGFAHILEVDENVKTHADLKVNTRINNDLWTNRDHDWFKVELSGGKTYQFDLNKAAGTSLDTYIWLRDASGNVLGKDRLNRFAYDDDNGGSASAPYDSRLIYEVASSGTYFIDVGSWQGRSNGNYALGYTVI